MKKNSNAIDILNREVGTDPEREQSIAEELLNAKVVQAIYDLRKHAGLTQSELARLVGTTQPVIARLEDADYRGHSLRMLNRIAVALGQELIVDFKVSSKSSLRGKRAAKSSVVG